MIKRLFMLGLLSLVLELSASEPVVRFAFDSQADTRYSKGPERHIHIEDLYIDADDDGQPQPLRIAAFSVFNLVSGRMETTIDNQSELRRTDDFWTGKAGSVMRITVIGEGATLRVIRITQ